MAYPCSGCKNAVGIPGDAHIGCQKPVPANCILLLSSGSQKALEVVQEKFDKFRKEYPTTPIMIRMRWPGCGFYPLAFDSNTIVQCSNCEKKEGEIVAKETKDSERAEEA